MTALGWSNPEDTATITILLRHGDTRLSPEHRFSGLSDEPLSADGARQVSAAAHRLACGTRVDAIVSSPLARAAGTASIVADFLGLLPSTDEDLRETDFGEWEGFTLAEIQKRWPETVAAWQRDPRQAPPGGESFADTACRVNRACERILRDYRGQTVLLVSHITPIKILLCRALGVPLLTMYRFYLGSACINEIQWHGDQFAAVRKVNDTSHLDGHSAEFSAGEHWAAEPPAAEDPAAPPLAAERRNDDLRGGAEPHGTRLSRDAGDARAGRPAARP